VHQSISLMLCFIIVLIHQAFFCSAWHGMSLPRGITTVSWSCGVLVPFLYANQKPVFAESFVASDVLDERWLQRKLRHADHPMGTNVSMVLGASGMLRRQSSKHQSLDIQQQDQLLDARDAQHLDALAITRQHISLAHPHINQKCVCPQKGRPGIHHPQLLRGSGLCPLYRGQWRCSAHGDKTKCMNDQSCTFDEKNKTCKIGSHAFGLIFWSFIAPHLASNECGRIGQEVLHSVGVILWCSGLSHSGTTTTLDCSPVCEEQKTAAGWKYNKTLKTCTKSSVQRVCFAKPQYWDTYRELVPKEAGGSCTVEDPSLFKCFQALAPDSCMPYVAACRRHASRKSCQAEKNCQWSNATDKVDDECDEDGHHKQKKTEEAGWCDFQWIKQTTKNGSTTWEPNIVEGESIYDELKKLGPCPTCTTQDPYKWTSCLLYDPEDPEAPSEVKATTTTTTTTTSDKSGTSSFLGSSLGFTCYVSISLALLSHA